jgi:hypothetical protein
MRALTTGDDFENIKSWLETYLDSEKSFIPCKEELLYLKSKEDSKSKGIYFWFMQTVGYKALSDFDEIKPVKKTYSIDIDAVKYDLVYLGTAGTGKSGNSNLAERFEWHIIKPYHTSSNICHGTLSTLRAGLGALLSDDLIIPDTENLVNTFMKDYMKVFWIEYSDNKSLIDNDEKVLINGIKPLLNLKNNPNARANAIANSTQVYKIRRINVKNNTLNVIKCKGESESIMKKSKVPTENKISYEEQILTEVNGCVEYSVLIWQDIAIVTRGIECLPSGKCKIEIWDSNNCDNVFKKWQRITGKNPEGQNIYTYFSNTSSDNINKRSVVLLRWMQDNNIEEITVRVCPIN